MAMHAAVTTDNYADLTTLIEKTKGELEYLRTMKSGDVTPWMDLIRTTRQPQIGWEIDYINPWPESKEIADMIRESERILFANDQEIYPKSCYQADIGQLSAFNTIRMHLRAEEGKYNTAKELFLNWFYDAYDRLSIIRKSNLLFHGCLMLLCCKNLQLSFDLYEKHWGIVKYASPADRFGLGLIDNHTILTMIYWFFYKHSGDVRDFLSIKLQTNDLWNHKKVAMLNFLRYDNAWVASFCGLSFYKYAQLNFPSLPSYEQKCSTPTNARKVWLSDTNEAYCSDLNLVGEERYFFEQFNREIDGATKYPNNDVADDFMYSFFHFRNDYVKDMNQKMSLFQFMGEFLRYEDFQSVLDAGSVLQVPFGFHGKDYYVVDISQKVCSILEAQKIPHWHGDITKFLESTNNKYDLCFCYDILSHLHLHRAESLLKSASTKCKYFCALIDTTDDFRTDILNAKHGVSRINVHRTIMTPDEWLVCIRESFSLVESKVVGNWLYVFCQNS